MRCTVVSVQIFCPWARNPRTSAPISSGTTRHQAAEAARAIAEAIMQTVIQVEKSTWRRMIGEATAAMK